MFKTLFSRMLVTYLAMTLLLLVLLGVTLGGMFRSQYIDEKESKLRREAEEINTTIYSKYTDSDKRSVARDQLYTIVRKYDALLQLYFTDQTLGRVSFMAEESVNKWEPVNDVDITQAAETIIEGGTGESVTTEKYSSVSDIPMLTLQRPITDADGNIIGAMFFHVDMSRTNASIRQVYMDVLLSALVAVLLAFLGVSYITNRMTKPIAAMNNTVKRFSKGDFEARVAVSGGDEVAELGQSFNDMANEINALEQSRRSFVANVSHELRSPLTSMRGFLEAIQDGTIPGEEQAKYLDIVINECKRMTGMVNDLLDLARIESGAYELKLEQFDINELVIRTLLTFEARVNARHIDVVMDFESDRTMVEADQQQIAQVIRNLVDNAIKFSPEGGKLTLCIKKDRGKAVVSVRDEGAGIAPEDLPYVFDRFYKGEKAHTPSGTSTGLGLSIVKRIVEQHNETITVESPPGSGACFTFTVKLHEQQTRQRPVSSRR